MSSCWWWGKSASLCFLAQEIGWGPTLAGSFAVLAVGVAVAFATRNRRR